MPASKWMCDECDWIGNDSEYLVAQNPFDPDYTIVGCPKCKEVNTMQAACDEPGCLREVSCGFPTPDGYRNTCGEHYHKYKEQHGE